MGFRSWVEGKGVGSWVGNFGEGPRGDVQRGHPGRSFFSDYAAAVALALLHVLSIAWVRF